MPTKSKATYRFHEIPIKVLMVLLNKNRKIIVEFIWYKKKNSYGTQKIHNKQSNPCTQMAFIQFIKCVILGKLQKDFNIFCTEINHLIYLSINFLKYLQRLLGQKVQVPRHTMRK